nr:reverse transcriptase domain-containing protein [Tanacetum cinerariifolium]
MMRVTTTFLRGEVVVSNRERKKSFPSWKQQEAGQRQNFKKGSFRNQQRLEQKQDRFTLLTKTPKEILALDKEKFKPPPPMTTSVEKRNTSKFCEFHGEVGHTTDECMHLKRQIKEMLKAGKLSHLIKELKQNNGKDQAKAAKKGETSDAIENPDDTVMAEDSQTKDYPNLLPEDGDLISPSGEEDGTGDLMIIEAEMGGHFVHRMHVDGCSSSEIIMDEFHGCKIAISIQRDHRKTGSKENPGISVHGSRNAKVPSDRRNSRKELCGLLRRNLDIFAWKPADMTGVLRHIAEHRLHIRKGCLPVRQKKRGQAPKRNKAIYKEVKKMADAGIMKEVHYHSWLSNPVMVKKHDGS